MHYRKQWIMFVAAAGLGLSAAGCGTEEGSADSSDSSNVTRQTSALVIAPGTESYVWVQMGSGGAKALDIGCGPRVAKGVWIIGKDGDLGLGDWPAFYWNGSNDFVRDGGRYGTNIDVAATNDPWLTDSLNGQVWEHTGLGVTGWTSRGPGAKIGTGAYGGVWRITNYHLSRWNGSSWDAPINGSGGINALVALDVDPTGYAWAVDASGGLWMMNSSTSYSQVQAPPLNDIGIGATYGSVYAISREPAAGGNYVLYHQVGTNTWKKTDGSGVRVSVDFTTGKPWVVSADGIVYAAR